MPIRRRTAKRRPRPRPPVSNLEAALPPRRDDPANATFGFAEFFEQVGSGLVEAQKRIDALSLEYVRSVRGQPLLTPAVFRIPRLTAQVKFALEKSDEKSVGFVFFQDRDTDGSKNQQTVEFEIVAAPAPPGWDGG